jgi:hypothetical protein
MPSIRHARVTLSLCFLAAMCEGFDVQAAGVAAAGGRKTLRAQPPDDGLLLELARQSAKQTTSSPRR